MIAGAAWSMHILFNTPKSKLAAGTYLFLDADIDKTVQYIKKCAIRARSNHRDATRIREYVAGAIDNFLPKDIDAGKLGTSAAVETLSYVQLFSCNLHVVAVW